MTRTIDFAIDSPVDVDRIHWAFSQEDYWRARMKTFGGMGKLKSLDVDPDGSVAVTLFHDLHPEGLPKALAKFFPRNWQVVQEETWAPQADGSVRGEVGVVAAEASPQRRRPTVKKGAGVGAGAQDCGVAEAAPACSFSESRPARR